MKKVIMVFLVSMILPIVAFAKYSKIIEKINFNVSFARPILEIVPDNQTINITLNNKEQNEFYFYINNYEGNEDIKISEIDLLYNIEIINSNENSGVIYELYDFENNKLLNGSSKTENFMVNKNEKYSKLYKLEISIDKHSNVNLKNDIYIKLNAEQIEGGDI